MRIRIVPLAVILVAAACASHGGSEATPTPTPTLTPTPTPLPIVVSGSVTDYFTTTPLVGAAVTTSGLTPAIVTTSGIGGAYSLSDIAPGSTFLARVAAANYSETFDQPIAVATSSRAVGLTVVSTADLNRQYSTFGFASPGGTATLFIDLHDATGAPLEGIAPVDITLVDAGGNPAAVPAPVFFGSGGDLVDNATLGVSTAYSGRARAAFILVPPGNWRVLVNHGTIDEAPVSASASANAVHLLRTP